jgi:hypothetical protein
MRFSVGSSIESRYHAAGMSVPSLPPAGRSHDHLVHALHERALGLVERGDPVDHLGEVLLVLRGHDMSLQPRTASSVEVDASVRRTPSGHVPSESGLSAMIQTSGLGVLSAA